MASQAETLKDCLFSLTVRVREIRAISLVDADGLPMVSNLGSGALDEALAAFGGTVTRLLDRAQSEFHMGPMYQVYIAGRDRQLFGIPVTPDATLMAVVEAHATPATVTMHLLALAREILPHLLTQGEVSA